MSRSTASRIEHLAGDRKLTILHCLWNGEAGGAERAVYLLVREQLRDPALAPALFFARGEGPYWDLARDLGCPVVALDVPHGHAARDLRTVTAAMRGFDIHHFHSAEPLLMLASLRCRGVRRVYTHRGGIIRYPWQTRIRYAATGAFLRNGFAGLSGNTAHAARCAARLFKIDEQRFDVTYNGLEFDLLEPERPAGEVRSELGLAGGEFVLGTAANLKRWKRIERLLLAIAAIEDPALRLLVIGDGEDRERLEVLAGDLGVSQRTVFTGLRLHVGDYLQVMDAFSLPSMALESFGNAAVEGMAMGIPTIVFEDGGGLVEHIEHGHTGFVVGSQARLESTLRDLLEDREWASRIGTAGRESVKRRYTPENAARAYRNLYGEAMQRPLPTPAEHPHEARAT